MTKLSQYPLSENDVRLWKLREEQPPLKRADLNRFLEQVLKGSTAPKKREKTTQDTLDNLVEEAKDLSGKIQENNDKELQLLKLDPFVKSVFGSVDSRYAPKQALRIITSGKGKPGTISMPSKKLLDSIRWVLPEGLFSADQQDLILRVKELRKGRSRLQNELIGIGQKLKVLTAKAIIDGLQVPQQIHDLIEDKPIYNEYLEDTLEEPATVEGIKIVLADCRGVDKETLKKKRTRAVELWQQLQTASGKKSAKAILYRAAGQDKRDFDRWCKGEHPDGSTPDKDIRRALTTDWD